jgi:hypothetical protein
MRRVFVSMLSACRRKSSMDDSRVRAADLSLGAQGVNFLVRLGSLMVWYCARLLSP